MSIRFLGEPNLGAPFNRTFFNAVIGDVVEHAGKDQAHRMTLYLSDGATLDVCRIEELAEEYMVLRTFHEGDETCDVGLEIVPYGLIYRIRLTPKEADDERLGFAWKPATAKAAARGTRRRPK
ncbi:MAG: hypothetical protein HYY17_10220 [Planctomycetes bacterium]|nr:hypothetical protein [Planctomycetota bacterium]